MGAYEYILENTRKLCNYILDYCDIQSGCQSCKLQGIDLDDKGSKCPIYIMSALDDALSILGVQIKE